MEKHVVQKTSQKKKQKKQKQSTSEMESFNLDSIADLGGEKGDIDLLRGIDEDEETIDAAEDLEAEPVKKDEIRDFLQQLGIDKIMQVTVEEPEKKKKVKLAKMSDADEDEGKKSEQQKEKKSKNKYKVQHEEVSSTTRTTSAALSPDYMKSYTARKYLLIKPGGKWHDHQFSSDPSTWEPVPEEWAKKLEQFATRLYEDESALYKKQQENKKSSDLTWMRTVLSSGTLSDKIAALTVIVQDSPVHVLSSLDTLIGMVKKKGRREALMAIDSIKELFLSDLLLDNRKLKTFEQHPLGELEALSSGNRDSRDKRLLLWHYEAQLKDRYANFVKALEAISHDTISSVKKKTLDTTFELLAGKSEQEKTLLSMLCNKLGDPDYKVASLASRLLTRLVDQHPNMKFVVVLEVERLLYRPNIASKAQYYAVCFLNQLVLSHKEKDLASRLITIYFSFFKSFVKKGEVDSKMLSGLLTGVNRAYPFAKVDRQKIQEQMNTLYKVIHVIKFSTSVQAFMLLYQVMDSSDSMSDRYYVALYKKMLDPGLKTCSKQTMFLNLLFKSMKKDVSVKRAQAFLKRLLQVCCYQSPPFICGALILLAELLKGRPDLLKLSKVGEDCDDEEEDFKDAPEEEGSEDLERFNSSDSEEEKSEAQSPQKKAGPSWVHRHNYAPGGRDDMTDYDPQHRNPLYCRADRECVWELQRLAGHYHPSVSLFAHNLLAGEKILYPGDPLQDFTLIRFLDRFVYRNPKNKEKLASSNIMKAQRCTPQGVKAIPVNSEQYLQLTEENVPADEKFFHKFFTQQASKKSRKKVNDYDSDASDVSDDEFDGYLDQYENALMSEAKEELHWDFAGEFGKKKDKKKKKGVEEDDDLDDDDFDLSDEEVDFADDDFEGEFDSDDDSINDTAGKGEDFDEEDVAFSDDGGLVEMDFTKKSKKDKRGKKRKGKQEEDDSGDEDLFMEPKAKSGKRSKHEDISSLFASAEEFAHIIDENVGSKFDMIGTEALANKDNADAKQLKWEVERDRWMKGNTWQQRKGKPKGRGKRKGGKGTGRK